MMPKAYVKKNAIRKQGKCMSILCTQFFCYVWFLESTKERNAALKKMIFSCLVLV